MTQKFTQKAQNSLRRAKTLAEEMGHSYIGSEHLLLGLSAEPDSIASRLLGARGADLALLQKSLVEVVGIGTPGPILAEDMTPRAKRIIELAASVADSGSARFVGTEHLLLSLLGERDCVAVKLLDSIGVPPSELKNDLSAFVSTTEEKSRTREERKGEESKLKIRGAPTLSAYGRDLSAMAADGRFDPIIGREDETERVICILSRRTKNNPCLVGEPGVGKTAVVEGLAMRIAEGSVPDTLKDRRIVALDIASMIAGAKYRGEFEERMKRVMDEVQKNPDIILFLDEFHMIVGAGAAEGAVDAANILKPALARGELRMIGATTISEYRAHIERDAALERRFQSVTVGEPTREETENILFGLRPKYEEHHALSISDEAIRAAVALSIRYIPDRFLPDKAIDLLDEAAADVRIAAHALSPEQAKKEEEKKRLCQEKEKAIAEQDFDRAADLRDRVTVLSRALDEERAERSAMQAPLTVTESDIARMVTRWTGIPVRHTDRAETKRLLSLEAELSESIVGQDEAISLLCRAIRRGRIGLKNPNRPIGSFLFAGQTGVGKTALCRSLATALFGDPSSLLRLDMSEYMEKHSVSKLIGSPPGYVGYGEGGQLTERVRRSPYSVILFDEIEKAHPDVFHLLLQILEDGRLTDSSGRCVNFCNTVLIMTSNLGVDAHTPYGILGFSDGSKKAESERKKAQITEAIQAHFRPEFLNRIDEIIIFSPLRDTDLLTITERMLDEVCARARSLGIALHADPSVGELIVLQSDCRTLGARPLRRSVTRLVEDALASAILEGDVAMGDCITARAEDGCVKFQKEKEKAGRT